jgi:tRNA modification GTPase
MVADLHDTICALSSTAGAGCRAIVRLSGPAAVAIVARFFQTPLDPLQRRCHEGNLVLPDFAAPVPADVYVWPAPKTYTGQDMVEVHVPGSAPLVELLIAACLGAGTRAARAGEFTMRAFLAGKLDLTRAEAVLAVIEAGNREELQQSLRQLAGGIAQPLNVLRQDLLDLLADVEAGLDFVDEDISFVGQEDLLHRITKGLALVTSLRQQLDRRGISEQAFRVVLAGRPNAGKSSLFNALARGSALVSSEPGTTRDYLVQRLDLDGIAIDLIDTAGWLPSRNGINAAAQELGRDQLEKADLILLCLQAGQELNPEEQTVQNQQDWQVVVVATKCDLAEAEPGLIATSTKTGQGLTALRGVLKEQATAKNTPALAPSLSRCRGHVEACLENLRRAHGIVLESDPPELLALELRGALEQMGQMVGAVYTEDLLDRIFSRFCIGK